MEYPQTLSLVIKKGWALMPWRVLLDKKKERVREDEYRKNLISYYSEAGPDYSEWSPEYNMHFGYYSASMNPFALEPMLNRMNKEVLERLEIKENQAAKILDMGCGLGSTARYAVAHHKNWDVTGITVVPWQISEARKLARQAEGGRRLSFQNQDYTGTDFPENSYEGLYAVESSCYAEGRDKKQLLTEAYRLLKPGGRLVIADGFLKGQGKMSSLLTRIYQKVCSCWSIDEFGHVDQVRERMLGLGFRDVQVEDISWRVALSFLYIPFVTLRFFLREIFQGDQAMTRERWKNVIAPCLSMLLGASRTRFGYYIITAKK